MFSKMLLNSLAVLDFKVIPLFFIPETSKIKDVPLPFYIKKHEIKQVWNVEVVCDFTVSLLSSFQAF